MIRVRTMLLLSVLAATVAGCQPSAPTATRRAEQPAGSLHRRTDRGEVLFDAVVNQLRDLAAYVDTELQPPVVILDSKKSRDGQDVLVMFGSHPDMPLGPINYVRVTSDNGRFRGLGVKPGDILKFSYVRFDPENMEIDIGETVTLDLTVAQVLNENALLIEGGLSQSTSIPQKIEIWRNVDDRLDEIDRQLNDYRVFRRPVFDWEPSPDQRVLKQIVERLNQWMQQTEPKTEWSAPSLLATLDPSVANDERLAALISDEALAEMAFGPHEGRLLQEAVWCRDISRWAQGESFDDVARATALFDWTVRNIQLDADADAVPNRPWQVLLFGHGTAEQRAWVFSLLCRQQGFDVVVLSISDDPQEPVEADANADQATESSSRSKFWLPALLSGGQLYLFDTRLGLPIPGADGQGVATLRAVQADKSLLRRLDLNDAVYPVTAVELRRVTASVVGSPFDLSQRAKALASKLSGDDRLLLTSRSSELSEVLRAMPELWAVKIWDTPFRTLRDQLWIPDKIRSTEHRQWTWSRQKWADAFEPFARRPALWKARVLHFQGHRLSDVDAPPGGFDEFSDDHDRAVRIYTSRSVRPTDRRINTIESGPERRIYSTAKADASYWVGLLLFDQGKYASAENWFSHPKLAAGADGAWASGTRYNLARTYEAQGKFDEAIPLLENDTSPQRHGNRLRARRRKR